MEHSWNDASEEFKFRGVGKFVKGRIIVFYWSRDIEEGGCRVSGFLAPPGSLLNLFNSSLSMDKKSFMVLWSNELLPSIQKMIQIEMNAVSVKLSELNARLSRSKNCKDL